MEAVEIRYGKVYGFSYNMGLLNINNVVDLGLKVILKKKREISTHCEPPWKDPLSVLLRIDI
jgi:hypothetical protein